MHPVHGRVAQVGPVLAGMPRAEGPVALPDTTRTDTDDLLRSSGIDAQTVADWRARGAVA